MYLKNLQVNDFRNIENVVLKPDPGFNVLWGDNAQGKTNFLEAIYLLGNLRSFRGSRTEELIRHHAASGRIVGEVINRKVQRKIELSLSEGGKAARIDGKETRKAGLFMEQLRPVLFSPEEVNLVKGYPAGRRSLLDRAVFQSDPAYLERAQEYDRCLRQRNRLLRDGRTEQEIAPWTEQLIVAGARVRFDRQQYLARLLPLLQEAYRSIASGREEAALLYPVESGSEEDLRRRLAGELHRCRERERLLRQTLAGPHRDDPFFIVDGRPARLFGSQGQQRSCMLAFKTAQIMDLESRTGEPPVLLLDDMTSELDRRRQEFFFRFLQERRGQVFITTTDIMPLMKEGISNGRFFRVDQGNIQEDCRE